MITQVNAIGADIVKDPRRKAQSVQFRHRANIPYTAQYNKEFEQQRSNALWTSFSIVAGSILFTVGYFMISAWNAGKKTAVQAVKHA